jgi:hypothetical protein
VVVPLAKYLKIKKYKSLKRCQGLQGKCLPSYNQGEKKPIVFNGITLGITDRIVSDVLQNPTLETEAKQFFFL